MIADLTAFFSWLFGRKSAPVAQPPAGALLGKTEDGRKVVLRAPRPERSASLQVLGASGSGKTALVVGAMLQEIKRGDGTSYLVVDPKGDAVAYLLGALCAELPNALARVHYLNPFTSGFPLNLVHLPKGRTPTELRAMHLAALVGRLSTDAAGHGGPGIGARQLDLLQAALAAALGSSDPDATPLWALEALTDERGLAMLARRTTPALARRLGATTKRAPAELMVSAAARLRLAFAASPGIERMLRAPTCISFTELLAPGAITILDLSDPLGIGELRAFFANLALRLALDHLLLRPSPWRGHHTRLIVDEAHLVATSLTDAIEELVTTGRSRSVSWVGLVQGTVLLSQASPALLEILLTNCDKLIGRLHARDAELLARAVAPSRGSDETFAAVRARVAARVVSFRDREFYFMDQDGRRRFSARPLNVAGWSQAASQNKKSLEALRQRCALADAAPASHTSPEEPPASPDAKAPSEAPLPKRTPPSRWG